MNVAAKRELESLFRAAVAAVDPARLVRESLRADARGVALSAGGDFAFVPWRDVGNIYLVGGGKAARAMGDAAAAILGERVTAGVVAVPRGSGGTEGCVRFVEAGHPLPDAGSRAAAAEMLALLARAGADDLVVALLSGGGSAMISAPPEGVSPGDKEAAIRLMLRSGADIAELNTLRKHLSAVKGGRMAAAAHPARVFALVLSDVPGDSPSLVASGPFSPDPTTYRDAMRILVGRRLCANVPPSVRDHVAAGVAGSVPETPGPGDPLFGKVACAVAGSNRVALEAAARAARGAGAGDIRVLPGFLRGEARACAVAFVAELREAAASLPPGRAAVLVAGGETTVAVRGGGRGGRSQEFALAAALALDGSDGIAVLAAGTDGVDGPTDAAGAFADGATCARARAAGLSPGEHLARNDSHPFFGALSDLLVTGPTGTNVADVALGVARAAGRAP
ncbi:MAG: glycerate kinase type-2 family protein [Gemmatimonadota bacterium]